MLSAVAGLTFHDLYFRFYEGAIASQQVVEFLQALERHIDRPLLLIWDRLPAHRSWLVQEFQQDDPCLLRRSAGGKVTLYYAKINKSTRIQLTGVFT